LAELGNNYLSMGRAIKGCSVTHAHEARAVYASLYGCWFQNIPSVITRRVIRPQRNSWFRDKAYQSAGAIAAVSDAVAEHIRKSYPNLNPIVVPDAHSNLPVDSEFVSTLRGKHSDKLIIVHVGTYDHGAKGQLTIIDAAKRAATDQPNWHFLLLGEGRERARFEASIGDLRNIELVGFVDNVGDYLAAADIFVFPSLHEALGSSLLDAMQFGLPIVATRVGGIPEFVEDGVNGRLIDTERPDQLFAAIEEVIANPEWAASVRAANIERILTLDAAAMADHYEKIYERIIL